MIRRHLFALGIAATAAFAVPAIAEEARPMVRTMSLTGHGEVRARPDLAVVTLGVLSQADTARAALDANNAAMTKIIAGLKQAGIEAKDLQTSNFSVAPRYEYDANRNGAPRTVGYDVSNTVTITLRKLDQLGGVLDQMVTAGSNQVNGVSFQIANPLPLQDEARKLAVTDARRKAELYAAAANVSLGPVIAISEGGGYQPPRPEVRYAMADSAEKSVPIAEGEQAVAIDVNIVWEIK